LQMKFQRKFCSLLSLTISMLKQLRHRGFEPLQL
jgi:hypothetical protein